MKPPSTPRHGRPLRYLSSSSKRWRDCVSATQRLSLSESDEEAPITRLRSDNKSKEPNVPKPSFSFERHEASVDMSHEETPITQFRTDRVQSNPANANPDPVTTTRKFGDALGTKLRQHSACSSAQERTLPDRQAAARQARRCQRARDEATAAS